MLICFASGMWFEFCPRVFFGKVNNKIKSGGQEFRPTLNAASSGNFMP